MANVPFPLSSTPGQRPGEGEGRLINAYAEKSGDTVYVRRTAGLTVFADTGKTGQRGLFDLSGTIYGAYSDGVVKVEQDGTATALSGSIPGTDGVTWARNNKVTDGAYTPDLVAVRESGGAFVVTDTDVEAYPDDDLPGNVNSVDFMDGYFLYTCADGRIFASELNSTDINALSFATAESKPDGLIRGIAHSGVFYAMGAQSIEPWLNVGAMPFPLQRGTSVIPVGLLTAMAVAGTDTEWDHPPHFVAHDGTVHALLGYQTRKVSTPDVEAFIAASTVSTLEACVYTTKGNAFWVLSSDKGTWELNVASGFWHERKSTGANRWRGSRSVKSNDKWVVGDTLSTNLLTVSDTIRTEAGSPVTWTIESAPLKDFPARVQVPGFFANFTEAENVEVDVSWSHDGGKTWANPLTRRLDTNSGTVRANRLGLSTAHGPRFRLSSSSEGDFAFMGASVPALEVRAP